MTERTVLDPGRLAAIIAEDRAKGYSLVDREAEPGFRSIAVPVRRYDGAVIAAINVGAHVDRVSPDDMIAQFLPPLKAAARAVQPLLM
jgi:IclR family pca regulon transcriptional regulator